MSTTLSRFSAASKGAPPDAAATKFAFNVMTTMGNLRTPPDILATKSSSMEVADGTRIFLAMIAGAYSANTGSIESRGSAGCLRWREGV
ncbi:hypothetical protein [Planomonospora parontospora]|uniref:hypothetical protein n=1 Tax=Planomonospora parontospora TaxID=58119 RepID=UPI00166FA696|nr:hypothetical protein [Planomonospora parontospora]